jgi:monoamine oxidase
VAKIFLEFKEPFWPKNNFIGYSFVWEEEDIKEARLNDKAWVLDIVNIFVVDAFPNLLEAFLAGDHLRAFENLSQEKVIEDCMWMLERFLHKTLPKPTKMERSKWLTNRNFLGAYSYFSMHSQENSVTSRDLAESVKNKDNIPVLLFAGEATDLMHPSYVHGAVRSGYRAADELISYYKSSKM